MEHLGEVRQRTECGLAVGLLRGFPESRARPIGFGFDIAWVMGGGFVQRYGALLCPLVEDKSMLMGRPPHPLRARALHLMRAGLATPSEIAAALSVDKGLVFKWRQRAGIRTDDARIDHVRQLLHRQPRPVPVIDEPDAAPF